ncbi:hypothetical protein ACFY15_08275 [Streptomyces sp. NPDC001373]|uniref:hypothetical protein n=1 Tax=Streptomyces sp. NPDC001373 TaxID=3364565 RepID=UPI0036948480
MSHPTWNGPTMPTVTTGEPEQPHIPPLKRLGSASVRRALAQHQLPDWLREGAMVVDENGRGRRGIVQFIGEWEDPLTRRVTPCAIFLRPEGGGTEWVVANHGTLTPG